MNIKQIMEKHPVSLHSKANLTNIWDSISVFDSNNIRSLFSCTRKNQYIHGVFLGI